MEAASCRVIYIDDRFTAEKWLSRDTTKPSTGGSNRLNQGLSLDLAELPLDIQTNVNAILGVFTQVYVCTSGRSFSAKLAEIYDSVKSECTPIIALFDIDSSLKHDHFVLHGAQKAQFLPTEETLFIPPSLKRQTTFSAENDESYGLQLLSRITSDLQVDEGARLVVPVALVRPKRKDSAPSLVNPARMSYPGKDALTRLNLEDRPSPIDSHMMLQCLDAGALDVVPSPLNNEKIMGLTVHAYRLFKGAKKQQNAFLASASDFIAAARRRKQSWVGIDEEKPYAYLREAMVKKLLKGICEPETLIEDYQHRELHVEEPRKRVIQEEVGKWSFCAHDFSEDELVYAGFYILDHALKMPELKRWRMDDDEILQFMQASRVAYNSFVLYHNFRHAIDVLQSLFYFLVQIGTLPPYPIGSAPPPLSPTKSPIASLVGPFEGLTLLISAIGHDVGHPGVNNMFLVKLNAPLAQLYNDQSVLEAFHCASYSQILRRHWPAAFADKSLRKLLISSILATDMGVHPDYMQRLGNLQERIHESKTTDLWAPKDIDAFKTLTCGLLIKCADISNVARPWIVAERWTHLLQQEFASQGEMEDQVGMETTLFGGPPEIGNTLKLANGQIGFMTIFAHPLFANVTDVVPAMGFAAAEILKNKGVWIAKIEHEKKKEKLIMEACYDGAVSPRSQSPARTLEKMIPTSPPNAERSPTSPPRKTFDQPTPSLGSKNSSTSSFASAPDAAEARDVVGDENDVPFFRVPFSPHGHKITPNITSAPRQDSAQPRQEFHRPSSATLPDGTSILGSNLKQEASRKKSDAARQSSGALPDAKPILETQRPQAQARRSSNTLPRSFQVNGTSDAHDESTTETADSSEHGGEETRRKSELRKSDYTTASVPLIFDDYVPDQPTTRRSFEHPGPTANSYHIPSRRSSRPFTSARHSNRMSVPTSSTRNSTAASIGQAQSTNLTTSTAQTSFLSNDSVEDLTEPRNASWYPGSKRGEPIRTRAKSTPSPMPQDGNGNPIEMEGSNQYPVPPPQPSASPDRDRRRKSTVKTTTTPMRGPGEDVVSSWDEGEGERSMRRRISRLRFWKRKSEDEER